MKKSQFSGSSTSLFLQRALSRGLLRIPQRNKVMALALSIPVLFVTACDDSDTDTELIRDVEIPVVSARASTFSETYVAENTIDNDLDGESRWSAEGVSDIWLELDLGDVNTVNTLNVDLLNASERSGCFSIQTSLDASEWVTQRANIVSNGETSFSFNETEARYIRYEGLGNSDVGSNWNSVIEISVYLNTLDSSIDLSDGDAIALCVEAQEEEEEEIVIIEVPIDHEPAELEVALECDANVPVGLDADMEAAITLAESRYTDLLARIAEVDDGDDYTNYTDLDGVWELDDSRTWTSGFLPGILWYLYGLTGTESWQTEAEVSSAGVRSRATATDNDTGFQIYNSYGTGRLVLGSWDEADTAINEGANTLMAERYNPIIGAFRAWPQENNDPFDITADDAFEVNVDMIMNMEIVLSAAALSGDTAAVDAAISHADVAWDTIMRPDFSSYHVAGFDEDANLVYNRTHQGWVTDSTWSRGQSWAVYGYAMLYRYTEEARMLERAEKSYQLFKQATFAQASSWVPYADFDAPIDIRNPLDTSAAAVVASSAIELYEITGNTLYLSDAHDILDALMQGYLSDETEYGSLLLAGSEQYVRLDDDTDDELESSYEVGASFGDFYFLEALYRLKNTEAPVCN